MPFLNWFRENQQQAEQSPPEQLSLELGFTISSHKPVKNKRIDSITARDDLEEAIADKGGDADCQAKVVEIQTEQIFGCTVNELYKGTGGQKGRRGTLPAEAQKAYQASDTVTAYAINDLPAPSGTQEQDNQRITDTIKQVNQKLAGFFPWNW